MQRCFTESKDPAVDRFTIVLSIQGDGALANLMVRLDFEETRCVLTRIREVHVPTPPHPDWWESLDMKVTP